MSDQMNNKLYFTGINPKGKYLTPPTSLERIVNRLRQEGWQTPPEWVLEWTREHTADEDDRLRKPVFETDRPWNLTGTGWGVVFAPMGAAASTIHQRRHNLPAWGESQIQPRFPVRRRMPSNRNWLR